ncbi:MAG: glucose-6-phosphate dehydrogenase (NADP(+)), partial [Caulobacteraceae bacterium]|nr:glucose-6-phosphate dehydrogenase (NADP(+)) [Caulobacteraceae bacterium]
MSKSKTSPQTSGRDLAPASPCLMVIFGARGDLAKRLLVPALYNLAHDGLLDDGFRILGVDHGEQTAADLRRDLGGFLKAIASDANSEFGKAGLDAKAWSWLESRIDYLIGDFEDPATYAALGERLSAAGEGGKPANVLFYLAVSPRFFGPIVEQLAKAKLTKAAKGAFRRVVVEKPFGEDLASAQALNKRILACLDESQIYRIDHFRGKETVRNIMVARFANGVFEPVWNNRHIDSVQITAAETVGVEDRGAFYDRTGALRDMIPSHLFQLLSLTAMDAPVSFEADALRVEKGKVIEAIRLLTPPEALQASVRGQYRAGTAGGRRLAGYRQSPDVSPRSRTETFVALKLSIDNDRWAGVPFY